MPEGLNGVEYVYGSLGRLSEKIPFSWSNTTQACGQSSWSRAPAAGTAGANSTVYSYDSPKIGSETYTMGRLSWTANNVSTVAYSYDSAGRVNAYEEAFLLASGSSSPWSVISSSYRNDGAITSKTFSGWGLTAAVNYNTWYDSLGRQVEVEDGSSNVYWSAVSASASVDPSYTAGATPSYDAWGRLGSYGSTATTGYWFDNGRATAQFAYSSQSNLLSSYDSVVNPGASATPMINVSGMTYQGSKLAGYQDSASNNAYACGYDSSDRLASANSNATSATGTLPAIHQTYGETDSFAAAAGGSLWNLQSVANTSSGVVTTYYYVGDELQWISNASSTASATYETIQDGNASVAGRGMVTSYTDSTGAYTYTYDAELRLTSITLNGAQTPAEALAYDPNGGLAVRTLNTGVTLYRMGGEVTLSLASGATNPTVSVNVVAGGRRIATNTAGAILYYHRDRQGTVIGTSQAGGVPGAMYRYDPYGLRTNTYNETAGVNASELGYTGALTFSVGGLVYLNARVYSPAMRRFLQADNVDAKRYTYAGGDPINHRDPTGHIVKHLGSYSGPPPDGDDWVGDGTGPMSVAGGDRDLCLTSLV